MYAHRTCGSWAQSETDTTLPQPFVEGGGGNPVHLLEVAARNRPTRHTILSDSARSLNRVGVLVIELHFVVHFHAGKFLAH
jgi:hypothetical protein